MKINFERTGTFQLIPCTLATKKTIRHFDIDELIKSAELVWELGGYKGNFQIMDEDTGEIICTLVYEEPKRIPKGFSQDRVAEILISETKNYLEELSLNLVQEDIENNKRFLNKMDGATDLVLALLDPNNFGDAKQERHEDKDYTDKILDLWSDFISIA